jgi:hypothetical protein
MTMTVKVKSGSGKDKFAKLMEQAKTVDVKVGWVDSSKYENGTPVAYVASIQEYGAPRVSIPPRPFMRPTIISKKNSWTKIIENEAKKMIDGEQTINQTMEVVGLIAEADVREKIISIQEPELSDVTLLLRKWKSQGHQITGSLVLEAKRWIYAAKKPSKGKTTDFSGISQKPLNDSGYMLATLTHKVSENL